MTKKAHDVNVTRAAKKQYPFTSGFHDSNAQQEESISQSHGKPKMGSFQLPWILNEHPSRDMIHEPMFNYEIKRTHLDS